MEILLQENDGLQLKLQSQEEDFRLQNQTLMQELSQVLQEIQYKPIQTIMKVSSKSLNYLPIFFLNSMVNSEVDS